jgi:hypothetical protein
MIWGNHGPKKATPESLGVAFLFFQFDKGMITGYAFLEENFVIFKISCYRMSDYA